MKKNKLKSIKVDSTTHAALLRAKASTGKSLQRLLYEAVAKLAVTL